MAMSFEGSTSLISDSVIHFVLLKTMQQSQTAAITLSWRVWQQSTDNCP